MASSSSLSDSLHSNIVRKPAYLSGSVVATWLAAVAFVAIMIAGWLHTKTTVEQLLREHVLAMSQLAVDRTALTFDSVGKALHMIGDGLQAVDTEPSRTANTDTRMLFQTMLIRARGRNPSVVALTITDSTGRPLASSPFHSEPGAILRPQDIPSLPQSDQNAPTISAPFRDPVSGIWLVRMTHRLTSQNRLAAGNLIADVAIDEALVHFFQQYPFEEGDIVSLHDISDRQLAVFPSGQSGLTGESTQSPLIGNAIAAEPSGTARYIRSSTDGVTHFVATRKLANYPFYVAYGKNVDAWLLKWHKEQFLLALASLAALIVTAALTTGIQRRQVLTRQLQKVRGDLEESNTALRATLATAELLASKDQMTGLLNRRSFDQRLEATIARSTRHGDIFSLLMIDIDHFKNINDYYGHSTGDDVLRHFGEVMSERLRPYDVAARWGGEEFVILADGANLDNARMLAEQMRESVAMTPFSPVPRVTISIGVAEHQEGESGDDLLKRADKALYSAKRNGRNRVIAAESSQMPKRQSA